MAKSKETYQKVAKTCTEMGNRHWAAAKNDPDKGYEYANAKKCYDTAQRAREAAKKAK